MGGWSTRWTPLTVRRARTPHLFDWIREIRGVEQERASGWSGVMTLPRILSLATDGSLQIEPVPELECLRMNPKAHKNITLNADD